ncbi:MAG: GMC family oxidoreductase [Deltaproteobacteria bacterium]|nr:GMC family oxidoreductase [Deltaproteobacteria bacterium]
MAMDEADVVIIGSGAGGAPVAAALAEAGARVVVLEKGPYYTVRDFVHDEVRICLRDFWVPYPSDDPHVLVKEEGGEGVNSNEYWTGLCVGGGTVHMTGYCYRFKESDFRLATLTGGIEGANVADWPIRYEELVPFYDLAEARMGVSGEAASNPFDLPRRPYPLPPLAGHPLSQLVDETGRALGYHPYPTPRAVLSRPYGGRPPCNQCGFCGDYGCENGSKSSMLSTLLPAAEATGRCEIRARCTARRIVLGPDNKAVGVEYVDEKGRARGIRARVVCLAASAVESARLLLLSATNGFPKGLANNNGLVGRNLTFSTAGKGTAIFDRAELIARLGAKDMDLPFLQRSLQDFYWAPREAGLPHPKGGTHNFILLHRNVIFAAQRVARDARFSLWGPALKEKIRALFHEQVWAEFEAFCEFLPWEGCYVELDPNARDRWGSPAARIHVRQHPADYQVSRRLVEKGLDLFRAMKPAPKEVYSEFLGATTPHLQHGSCRFGDDPATSVLDRNCQAHEVKNLYVTDGSFMPTSGSVPATLTIVANSLRVAHHLRERFVRREI